MKHVRPAQGGPGSRALASILCLLLALSLAVLPAAAQDGFTYQHDPRLNPKVMTDVVVNPDAIYGFSPSLTGTLKQYADSVDWTDPEVVQNYQTQRIAYHQSMQGMYDTLLEMRQAGKSTEEIARTVSAQRNAIRIASYENDPEGLAEMKARNLETYGREEGPTPDDIYAKYGDWETVIEKAFSPNLGMDVCLGLYDQNYPYYLAMGLLPDEAHQTATREYAVSSLVRVLGKDHFSTDGPVLDTFRDADRVTVWFREDLAIATAGGILKGFEDGTLRPQEELRRVEAFVLLARCLPQLTAVRDPLPFTDVPDWARADLDRLSAAGLVEGYGDSLLGAEDSITVEQVGILAVRLGGLPVSSGT